MNKNIQVFKNEILEGLPNKRIQYQFTNDLHKFRIEGEGEPTYWLYVNRELEEDCEPIIILNLIRIYHIVDTLNKAVKSKWLYMGPDSMREVDENFAK